jgi:hypothetical protein
VGLVITVFTQYNMANSRDQHSALTGAQERIAFGLITCDRSLESILEIRIEIDIDNREG